MPCGVHFANLRSLDSESPSADEAEWTGRLEQLRQFVAEHGHARVPRGRHSTSGLRPWLVRMRRAVRRGELPPSRADALAALGVDAFHAKWEQRFRELTRFKARYQDANPARFDARAPALGIWVARQRALAQRGVLLADRGARLEALGVRLWPERERWEEQLRRLTAFAGRFGHGDVPGGWKEDPTLANFVGTARYLASKGRLTAERRAQLEALGVTFALRRTRFERRLADLRAWRAAHPDGQEPPATSPGLGAWLVSIRGRLRRGELEADQVAALAELGVREHAPRWTPPDAAWEQRFRELAEHRERTGSLALGREDHGSPLGWWLARQRQDYHRGKLAPDRVRRLEELGITWDPAEAGFEERLRLLEEYRREHGHLAGPYPFDSKMQAWMANQRRWKRQGRLSAEHQRRLDALGFVWEPGRKRTHDPFLELAIEHRKKHGHLYLEPAGEHRALARWAEETRRAAREGTLEPALKAELEAIGFPLDRAALEWERGLALVVAWGERHEGGLPKPGTAAGRWIAAQVEAARQGRLGAARRQRLEEAGVELEPRAPAEIPGSPEGAVGSPPSEVHVLPAMETKERPLTGKSHAWERLLEELRTFYEERGTLALVAGMPHWVRYRVRDLRRRRRRGGLTPERIAALDAMKFQWEDEPPPPPRARLRKKGSSGQGLAAEPEPPEPPAPRRDVPAGEVGPLLAKAVSHREREGHWILDGETDPELKAWFDGVSNELAAGVLESELADKLRRAGVPATHEAWQWERQFARVKAWSGLPFQDPLLLTWLNAQRLLAKGGQLAKERLERLKEVGIDLNAARLPQPPAKPTTTALPPQKQKKRVPRRDPAAVSRDELRSAGVPEAVIRRWLQEERLLKTAESNVFLKTRGMTEEIERYKR